MKPSLSHLPSSSAEVCLARFVYVCVLVSSSHCLFESRNLVPTSNQPSEDDRQGKDHSDEPQPRETQSRDCRAPARGQVQRPGGGGWSQRTDWRFPDRREAYPGLSPEGSPPGAHLQAHHLRSLASRTAKIYNGQGAAGDPRLGGGGTYTRSPERATATHPRAFLGDQKPSPKEADEDPESMARNPLGTPPPETPRARLPTWLALWNCFLSPATDIAAAPRPGVVSGLRRATRPRR